MFAHKQPPQLTFIEVRKTDRRAPETRRLREAQGCRGPVTASECGDVQVRTGTTLRIRGKKENERESEGEKSLHLCCRRFTAVRCSHVVPPEDSEF